MDIFSQFATDETLEMNGRWIQLDANSRIRVARENNDNYQKAFREKWNANEAALQVGDAHADEIARGIFLDVLAETILVGWEGLTYKGKAIKYSVENAKKLLAHKDFRKLVETSAADFAGYRAKLEEEQGND